MARTDRDLSTEQLEAASATIHAAARGRRLDGVRLPNLVGVGTARAGTTFLYGLLRPQPQVYVTPVKEANYFAVGSRGKMTLREYRMLFWAQAGQPWIAEITPVYLHRPGAMEMMAEDLSTPKVIINVREPVSRLISHFKYFRAQHGFTDLGAYIDTALEQGLGVKPWIAPGRAVLLSLYADAIGRAFRLFGRENCCILNHADLAAGPEPWLARLSAFLGVELVRPDREPGRHNTPPEALALPATPAAHKVLEMFEADAAALSELLGPGVVQAWRQH